MCRHPDGADGEARPDRLSMRLAGAGKACMAGFQYSSIALQSDR